MLLTTRHSKIPPLLMSLTGRFFLIACFFLMGCTHFANDSWTGKDKAQHFFSSAAFAVAGTAYAEHQNLSHGQAQRVGMLFSISLGATKEFYDSREGGTGWSVKDFVWDIAGAFAGYHVYCLTTH